MKTINYKLMKFKSLNVGDRFYLTQTPNTLMKMMKIEQCTDAHLNISNRKAVNLSTGKLWCLTEDEFVYKIISKEINEDQWIKDKFYRDRKEFKI